MKDKTYHIFLLIASILLISIPLALVSGPFLTDLFIVIISIIFLFIFKNNKELILFRSTFFKLFLLFYFYLIITSFFSENINVAFKPSITYIRFGLFALAILYIINNYPNFKKFFFFALLLTLSLLLFDGYFQFIFGKNIFGFKVVRVDRLGGLFFDELILGSYLSKILPIFCTFYILNKNIMNKKIIFLLILLSYVLIFLSGERMAFLTISLYFLMITPFFLDIKKIIIFFALMFLTFTTLILTNENIKDRYFDQMIIHTIKITDKNKTNILPEHMGLFSTAFNIFKDKPLFGGGLKTFRINCKNPDYVAKKIPQINKEKEDRNCSTHPHNFYLQLLSETGIFGFLFIFVIFLKLLTNYFTNIISHFKQKVEINQSKITILCGLITFLWPLATTGSFFNNWICSILFLQVGIYLYTKSIKLNK